MALLLGIETATDACSVCIADNGQVISLAEDSAPRSHAAVITSLIDEAARKAGITLSLLDAVAVSKGPGSYTGLRIGAATAKGICYALIKPLVAVNTLEAMASGFHKTFKDRLPGKENFFVPCIDARRLEVYAAVFNNHLQFAEQTAAIIINHHSFSTYLSKGNVCFFGNGSAKIKSIINSSNAFFFDGFIPSASMLVKRAEQLFADKNFENPAHFEPFYLKDFLSSSPKKS